MSGEDQFGSATPGARRPAPVDLRAGSLTAIEPSQAQVFCDPAVAGRNLGAGVGLLLFGSLILFHTVVSPTVPFTSKTLIIAAALPIPLFLILRLARGGVVCERSGIMIRNPFRHVRLKWEEIDHFEQHSRGALTHTAWVYNTDGSSIRIYGMVRSMSRSAQVEAQPLIEALNQLVAAQRSTG